MRLNKTKKEIIEGMEQLKQDILALAIPNEYSKAAKVVTISQGAVNLIPKQGNTLAHFLKMADEGLYEAKKISKNTVVFMENERNYD